MAWKSYGEVKCVDCGKLFLKKSHQMIRCRDCQVEHKKKADNKRKKKKGEKDVQSDVAHIPLCKRTKSCKYGTRTSGFGICDYIGIEGHSRGCPVEGCTKYVRRKRKGE